MNIKYFEGIIIILFPVTYILISIVSNFLISLNTFFKQFFLLLTPTEYVL